MKSIIIDSNSYLNYRSTPWDTKAFDIRCNEILEISYQTPGELQVLISKYETLCEQKNIEFSYVRINSNDNKLQNALQQAQYYYAETTITLSNNNINKTTSLDKLGTKLNLTKPNDEDFENIKKISNRAFNFGRFHEDSNISTEKANRRFYNWIDDLKDQQKQFLQYKNAEGRVLCFMAFHTEEDIVHLVLGGSDVNHGHLSPYFWSALLLYFRKNGFRRIVNVHVSASNITMLNIYSLLQFSISQTLIGFHKMRNFN